MYKFLSVKQTEFMSTWNLNSSGWRCKTNRQTRQTKMCRLWCAREEIKESSWLWSGAGGGGVWSCNWQGDATEGRSASSVRTAQEGFSEEVYLSWDLIIRSQTKKALKGLGGGNSQGGPVCLECSKGRNDDIKHLNGYIRWVVGVPRRGRLEIWISESLSLRWN